MFTELFAHSDRRRRSASGGQEEVDALLGAVLNRHRPLTGPSWAVSGPHLRGDLVDRGSAGRAGADVDGRAEAAVG
ncbi:MAG: hypothetical protein ACJ72W_05950 [Actinoallomurus sp.]